MQKRHIQKYFETFKLYHLYSTQCLLWCLSDETSDVSLSLGQINSNNRVSHSTRITLFLLLRIQRYMWRNHDATSKSDSIRNLKVIILFGIPVKINGVQSMTLMKNVYVNIWFRSEKINGA